jgi:hypothetical protein
VKRLINRFKQFVRIAARYETALPTTSAWSPSR